jgi:hypothetical protein
MTPGALLELQHTDSAIDQLRLRMPKLPEVVASAAADAEVRAWEARRDALRASISSYEAAINNSEQASHAISKQRDRLESQLKTIIAPREAEALMHEIANLNSQRSALDDDELVAMDGLSAAEAELAEHLGREELLRNGASAAAQTAATARVGAEAELASLIEARDAMRAAGDDAALKMYDTMRGQHNGIAVAKLNGLRCEGCHLDLSRGEVDDIKRMPADALPECPNCGRLLVR